MTITAIRLALVLVGSVLLCGAVWRNVWELWSWGVMCYLNQKPPYIGDRPNIQHFWQNVWLSALGLAAIIMAFI